MNTTKELLILGAGGFAAEVIEAAHLCGWTVKGIYDDDPTALGREVMGVHCVGTIGHLVADFAAPRRYAFAIGNNAVREEIGKRFAAAGFEAIALVHPAAVVSRTAHIGAGAFVGPQTFIGPQAKIGLHAIVNVGASIGHDSTIADFAQICPGVRVSGFAKIGRGAFLGSNSIVTPRGIIGDWAKLGAGSFAARNVPDGKLAIGVPARIVEE